LIGKSNDSLIYLPLSSKGKVLGVISVQTQRKNAYTEYHLNFLRSIGVYAAIALEKALLYREVEQAVHERTQEVVEQKEEIEKSYQTTRLLSEIGQQLTSTLDFDALFTRLHYFVNQLMDASCFGVRIYDSVKNEVDYRFEMEKGEKSEPFSVSMDDLNNYSVWCIRHKKEIFINDNLTEYSRYTSEIRVPAGDMPHSLIFYPLMMGERILGVITVQSFERNAYKPHHLDILKTLASYTAIAFENANLYENLEEKVKERTAEVIRQKEIIEVKNKDITDSIKYAKKIQQAILPANQDILNDLPQSFIFYKPKDIVSGDFYWYASLGDIVVFAVADCTGHGVPGAFMSAICNDLMNQVIRDGRVTSPGMALQLLDIKLRQLLNKSAEKGANDGMDIALCALNIHTNVLQYAGAHRPLLVMRNGEAMEFRADRHSIGGYNTGQKQFTDHEVVLKHNDILYLFTDGYTDQFGGPKGKKFKYRKLKELLVRIESLPIEEQQQILDESIEEWRKDYDQVDDILLFGVRI
ncbi:MAG TPA: GAF domain-containing protein, partial [Bacteroidia bacterium]|nr:GAF domain-containing protein [Bacteroidia bacterium]